MITVTNPAEQIARAKSKDNIDVEVSTKDRCDSDRIMTCYVQFNAEEYPVDMDSLLANMRKAVLDSCPIPTLLKNQNTGVFDGE
jgi:hypothetical protein